MRTQDLGGYATTQDFTAAVVKVSNSIVGGVNIFVESNEIEMRTFFSGNPPRGVAESGFH